MRAYLGVLLLFAGLPSWAQVEWTQPQLRLGSQKAGVAIEATCADHMMDLMPLVRKVQSYRNQFEGNRITDVEAYERELTRLTLLKSRCIYGILLEVFGSDFRVDGLKFNDYFRVRYVESMLTRLKNRHINYVTHPGSIATVAIVNEIERAAKSATPVTMDSLSSGIYLALETRLGELETQTAGR